MKKTLFYVNCTTCGARIRFYDGSRLGQIISCPKCESMVLVEKTGNEESAERQESAALKNEPAPKSSLGGEPLSLFESDEEDAGQFEANGTETEKGLPSSIQDVPPEKDASAVKHSAAIPVPPPVPGTVCEEGRDADLVVPSFSEFSTSQRENGHMEDEIPSWPYSGSADLAEGLENAEHTAENEEAEFEFEGTSAPGWTPRGLMLIMGCVAAGIFLAGVLLFSFLKKDGRETALELELPDVSEGISKDSQNIRSDETEPGMETDTADPEDGETGAGEEEPDAVGGTDSPERLGMESEDPTGPETLNSDSDPGADVAEPDSGAETGAESGSDPLQNVMQSALGKKLSEDLGAEIDLENAKLTEEIRESSGNEEGAGSENSLRDGDGTDELGTPDEEDADLHGNSENAENAGLGERVSENVLEETHSGSDPDVLVFNRKKRSRIYSGDDPVLNFDSAADVSEKETESTEDRKTGGISPLDSADGEEGAQMEAEESSEKNGTLHARVPGEEEVQETAPLPQMKTFRIQTPEVEYLQRISAEKLAIPLESISLSRRPVSALMQFASQMSGERITADWRKLGMLGVSQESPVSLVLEKTTLREALDTGLYSVDLGIISVGSTLRLVGWEAAEITRSAAARGEKPTRKVLELEDLAATYATEASGQSGLGEIAKIIPQFVHPSLWEERNGIGRLTANAAKSRISLQQFPSVIQEVEIFCDKIRRARNMELRTLPTQPGQRRKELRDGTELTDAGVVPRYALSEKVRRTPIDCDLSDGTTLRQALTEVMRCAGAQVVFDEEAIALIPISAVIPDADVPDFDGKKRELPKSILDLPCVYRFEGIPMEEAATDILKNVPLFCYPVDENIFFLTTYRESRRKMLVDFYPVGDLIRNSAAAGTIINGICSTIETGSWMRNGGAGAIYFDLPSKTLIVRQNPLILYQIEMFLKRFRETRDPNSKMGAKKEG